MILTILLFFIVLSFVMEFGFTILGIICLGQLDVYRLYDSFLFPDLFHKEFCTFIELRKRSLDIIWLLLFVLVVRIER